MTTSQTTTTALALSRPPAPPRMTTPPAVFLSGAQASELQWFTPPAAR